MVLHSYNPSSRYRQKRFQTLSRFFKWTFVIVIAGIAGFWIGQQNAIQKDIQLKEEVIGLRQEREVLNQTLMDITAQANIAKKRYNDLKQEFENTIPDGEMRDLLALLKSQLESGMKAERLKFAIQSARPPTDCSDSDVKSFFIVTPHYQGERNYVVINDADIRVQGNGLSAKNDKGQPEAWYDPAKEVTIDFIYNQKKESKSGVLPIQHSIVLDGREYRFNIEPGAKSYAKVIYDSCAYP